MKKIIVPKFSEYIDKEWRTWSVPADIIVKITKKELTDLLMSKIWHNNCWEYCYTEIILEDWTTINVEINNILFNPKKWKKSNKLTTDLQDLYLDEWTEVTIALWDWTWYEWHLTDVMCPKINLDYKRIIELKEWNNLKTLEELKIKQDNWSTLVTDISNVRLVN